MANATIYPIFSTADGTPFVFWNTQNNQLLIRHGKKFTVIYYDIATCLSCKTMFTGMQLLGSKEIFIYNNKGRTVASFLPQRNALIIMRDGQYFVFECSDQPVGYGDCPVDQIPIFSFHMPGNRNDERKIYSK